MTRFLADMKIWVEVLNGPEPTADKVVQALDGLLKSDHVFIAVENGDTFTSCRIAVGNSEGKARVIK